MSGQKERKVERGEGEGKGDKRKRKAMRKEGRQKERGGQGGEISTRQESWSFKDTSKPSSKLLITS